MAFAELDRHQKSCTLFFRSWSLSRNGGVTFTVVKLDLQKAFDTVYQSAILQGLQATQAHPRFVFSLARELLHSSILPDLWGTQPDQAVPLERGCRQGAPESGLFFILGYQCCSQRASGQMGGTAFWDTSWQRETQNPDLC